MKSQRIQEEPRHKRQAHHEPPIEWNLVEIPAQLIRNMAELKLAPSEFIFLAYLLAVDSAWKQGGSIAVPLHVVEEATGLSIGTIHAAKRGLIAKGFMTVLNIRNQARTNTYDLSPLRQKLCAAGTAATIAAL
jgi:hypothetical protein